ncbi:MAG: sensor domain-containing diguanylate cyclase [Colwellia sp.]|nr:sensor domain-containing diguanylate cyclase [Colwellia sp.]
MKFINKFDRYITVIFFFTIITIVATSYFTFKEFFSLHSQRQQQAIIPLYSLITNEIVRPLTIAQFMANDKFLIDYAQQDKIETALLFDYISTLAKQFQLLSFVALEKHNLMIDANNKITSLFDEEAEWFYRLKKLEALQFADIGNSVDPHLYFDVKIMNDKQEFLGFAGVAVDLDQFAKTFSQFYQRFGFEVFFVDENDNITLSSSALMKTDSHHRKSELVNINSLDWYQSYLQQQGESEKNKTSIDNSFPSYIESEFIISQLPLKDLNWRVFIVAPEASQQSEYWLLFFSKLVIFILVSLVLYYLFNIAINYFKVNLVKDSETDHLTKLPNRSFIHWKYSELNQKHDNVCVVIADIDNFKAINDSYGHLIGDDALKIIANKLSESLRNVDLAGRWGGEEFIILLPDTTAEQALEIIDRIRVSIENISFSDGSSDQTFNITVSFGISDSSLAGIPLKEIISKADKALYQAKENGRNQVVIHLE